MDRIKKNRRVSFSYLSGCFFAHVVANVQSAFSSLVRVSIFSVGEVVVLHILFPPIAALSTE